MFTRPKNNFKSDFPSLVSDLRSSFTRTQYFGLDFWDGIEKKKTKNPAKTGVCESQDYLFIFFFCGILSLVKDDKSNVSWQVDQILFRCTSLAHVFHFFFPPSIADWLPFSYCFFGSERKKS